MSVVWYALLRIDEKLDAQYPTSRNIIEDRLTPILVKDYKKRKNMDRLDSAVLLGGPAIAEFLLKQDWQGEPRGDNFDSTGRGGMDYVNKWQVRLVNLDDPAGEKFRAEHRDIVVRYADTWAEKLWAWDFRPPRFLLLDRHKGSDSFACQYWPRYSDIVDKVEFLKLRMSRKIAYLKMLEPFITTQMYFDAWVRVLDEPKLTDMYPRDLFQRDLPEHRKEPLATMLLEEVNKRLEELGPRTIENRNMWDGLDIQRRACNGVLNK